jgi:hypothetical protein
MRHTIRFSFCALLVGIGLAIGGSSCLAAGGFMNDHTSTATNTVDMNTGGMDTGENVREQSWYREQATKPDTRVIVQQKAQVRAQQRMDRMASMQWYGMSNSRPQGSTTPFSSRYSPTWEMPGGQPYSWFPNARPGYVMYWR